MRQFKYIINGHEYEVHIDNVGETVADVEVNGERYKVQMEATEKKPAFKIRRPAQPPTTAGGDPVVTRPAATTTQGAIKTPLPGVVIQVSCKVGDLVKRGQTVVILEAMKMENNIPSDRDGKVLEIKVSQGDTVLEGDDLVVIG